jgi:hypothetical protein
MYWVSIAIIRVRKQYKKQCRRRHASDLRNAQKGDMFLKFEETVYIPTYANALSFGGCYVQLPKTHLRTVQLQNFKADASWVRRPLRGRRPSAFEPQLASAVGQP